MTTRETIDPETAAAMAWTRLADGEDATAVKLIEEMGYREALAWLRRAVAGKEELTDGLAKGVARWAPRLKDDVFATDRATYLREKSHLSFVHLKDELYPPHMKHLGDVKPLGLWIRGNPEILHASTLSMVGSRSCTPEGRKTTTEIAYDMAQSGVLICSGGALGVDTAAHMGAVEAQKPTAVVLAGGIDVIYPTGHKKFFDTIVDLGGAIISESPPGSISHRYKFLARNRIIAALGKATFVVQAPLRSGAINTAYHAFTIGREVGALPENRNNPFYQGNLRLLREGATLIRNTNDVVEMCGWEEGIPRPLSVAGTQPVSSATTETTQGGQLALSIEDPMAGNPLAVRVRDALPARGAITVENVAINAGLSIQDALAGLGMLSMAQIVTEEDGKWRLQKKARQTFQATRPSQPSR